MAALGGFLAALALSCATEPPKAARGPLDGCDRCHTAQADELRTARHFEQAIRCITCHGRSEAHAAKPTLPPDHAFSPQTSDALCSRCHRDECRYEGALRTTPTGTTRQRCTDCHGAHRIELNVKGRGSEGKKSE
jgi:hypothetical protein